MSQHWFDLSAIPETRRRRATGLTVTVRGVEWYEPEPVTRKRASPVTEVRYGKDGKRVERTFTPALAGGKRAAAKAARIAEQSVVDVYVSLAPAIVNHATLDGTVSRAGNAPTSYGGTHDAATGYERARPSFAQRKAAMVARRGY